MRVNRSRIKKRDKMCVRFALWRGCSIFVMSVRVTSAEKNIVKKDRNGIA